MKEMKENEDNNRKITSLLASITLQDINSSKQKSKPTAQTTVTPRMFKLCCLIISTFCVLRVYTKD